MKTPVGLQEIIETFGDIGKYIEDDGRISAREESQFLVTIPAPYSMQYAYNPSTKITKFTCHRLMTDIFTKVFEEIFDRGLTHLAMFYGGCYMFRAMRGGNRLSTHSWGIAMDINPITNYLGTPGDMDPRIIKIFMSHGFTWGGTFKRNDPMHFQFCTGY